MRFAKYHGIGNDFVMVADPDDALELTPELVRRLCDRRFGIGADGAIRVARATDGGGLFMDYVNSDGSIGEMCGNGIRCLAVFARDQGLTDATELKVQTRAGLKVVTLEDDGLVRVDMGAPVFAPPEIPVRWDGPNALDVQLDIDGETYSAACVSMGNPHAVLSVPDASDAPVTILGPKIEHHDAFPNKTNVGFMTVADDSRISMRVWERGSGETLACGTGACAVAVVGRLVHGTASEVTVSLPGGEVVVEWEGSLTDERPVYLTGPAVRSFEGEIEL